MGFKEQCARNGYVEECEPECCSTGLVISKYMPLGRDECCLRYVCSIVIVLLRIQSFCNNYVIPHDFEPLTVS